MTSEIMKPPRLIKLIHFLLWINVLIWMGFGFFVGVGFHPSFERLSIFWWIFTFLSLFVASLIIILGIFLRKRNKVSYILLVFL
ncbi:MAG: hypothetical protein NTZ74_15790 [Chloroflexi bacterium]|nr:hypothetical protein [Chloroflexota bacterium]